MRKTIKQKYGNPKEFNCSFHVFQNGTLAERLCVSLQSLYKGVRLPRVPFILQLPERTSKDVMCKSNRMYQFHQKIRCRTHTDLNDHYQKVH